MYISYRCLFDRTVHRAGHRYFKMYLDTRYKIRSQNVTRYRYYMQISNVSRYRYSGVSTDTDTRCFVHIIYAYKYMREWSIILHIYTLYLILCKY